MSWKALITDAGNELSAKTISGGNIKLTHAKAGSGTVSEQDLHLQTELVNVKQTLSIESIKYSNAVNNIEILLDCRGLKEAYDLAQIGIYATDPDAREILFAIAQTENPKHIPAENEVPFYSIDFNFAFALKNNQNMVATIDQSTFATKEQLSAVDARIDNIIVNAGSTEDNAELIDMRVDVDGKRHSTAGEALRSQLKQKANLTDISSPYQFRGACLSANLPGSGNKINDTYYVTDKKCKFTWNGAAWYQSSLNESDYEEELSSLTEDLGNIGKVIEVGGEKTITTPQLADISTIKVGRPTFKYHQTKYNDELSSEEYYRTLDAIEFTDESIKTLRLNFKPASIICFRAQDGMAEGVVPIANVTDNGDNSFSFATTTANKAKWIRISWSNTRYPNLVPLVTNEDEWDANADKTFIGSKIIKLPTSLKDKVVNISNLGDDVLKLFNPEIINPCDYKGDEIRIFGKGLCIGDSLTYGQSDRNDTGSLDGFKHAGMNYPDNLMRLTGIDLTNAGTAGKTFQTWWELHENDDFSGHDFCIIALGVNDAYFNKMWTDDSLTYLTNIVNAVRTANNHIPIFITTPPMYFLGYTGADFESVAEGIRNAATSLNLYLVDFRKYLTEFSRVNAEKVSVMAYGHFNAYGYYKIAVAYKSYISYIISQNMDDFRNVQFVGTNYSYSSN